MIKRCVSFLSIIIGFIFSSSMLFGAVAPVDITAPGAIVSPGIYIVANDILGTISVTANNVQIDLNSYVIESVSIGAVDNVLIKNGTVQGGSPAISAAGSTNVFLENVRANNAEIGIDFNNVMGGHISNCEMTQNVTGLELNNSSKIIIDNCVAHCNQNAGFCLISSTTNIIQNSQSISTGQTNEQTENQTIFGFVASNGYANIFENCIANSTQGLQVTDFDSLIAGFALRGSEGCTKIINCEAANAQTSVAGVTIPYGILIESSIGSQITLTATPPIPVPMGDVLALEWSSDQKLLAVGTSSNELNIYTFDNAQNVLSRVAIPNTMPEDEINSVSWHPSGKFLAIGISSGDTYRVRVYEWCSTNNSLSQVATPDVIPGGDVTVVEWSSSGKYLAVGGTDDVVRIYAFDAVQYTLIQGASPLSLGGMFEGLAWHPSERFMCVTYDNGIVAIYNFISATLELSFLTEQTLMAISKAISWTADGKYLAVVGQVSEEPDPISIFEFNGMDLDFSGSISQSVLSTDIQWSADGRYLAVGQGTSVYVYPYDRTAGGSVGSPINANTDPGSQVFSVDWSPDGQYLAVGSASVDKISLYEAISFPSNNVITKNIVYCNSGNACPGGVGISGSSIANMIIGNTSYSNPIPQLINKPFAQTNYEFVTNVFNQLFGQAPIDLQNISVPGCDPISMPDDSALLAKQVLFEVGVLESTVEALREAVACSATPLSPSSIPTTITVSGFYCLEADLSATTTVITITADNVTVDLNNYLVDGGIEIRNSDHCTLFNGTVQASSIQSAILVSSSESIRMRNIIAQDSLVGIDFHNVSNGTIEYCSLTQNITGLELNDSNNIVIDNTVAGYNFQAGFSLLSSTTNCLQNCTALSTGGTNSETENQQIYGFVSRDGNANIFEQCIANSTQGLYLIDYASRVAGFGLLGSESCTKIIGCESANAQTNVSGIAVPYGIYLDHSLGVPNPDYDPMVTNQPEFLVTLTAVPVMPSPSADVQAVEWRSDQKFYAAGFGSVLAIYAFDDHNALSTRAVQIEVNGTINQLSWHPGGEFIAIATTNGVFVYEFCSTGNSLTQIAAPETQPSANVLAIDWHPNGVYLAVGTAEPSLSIYSFDLQNLTLLFTSLTTPFTVNDIEWHPTGTMLLAGLSAGANPQIYLYSFNSGATQLVQLSTGDIGNGNVLAVSWSPDGKYIAASGQGLNLSVLAVNDGVIDDSNPKTYTLNDDVFSISWSADGSYMVIGMDNNAPPLPDFLSVLYFDRDNPSPLPNTAVSLIAVPNIFPIGNVNSVDWSPDGQFILAGTDDDTQRIAFYEALSFVSKNVIKSNTIYCNSGNACPFGIGISGSSIANMIIGNTAYSNPVPPQGTQGAIVVNGNYQFVTNVFNQRFGQAPSDLQNISVEGCQPICAPIDLVLLAKQIKYKLCATESILDDLSSHSISLDCSPMVISNATTLSIAGFYCVENSISGSPALTITADNVSIDLNMQLIDGGIAFSNRDNIKICNGIVQGDASSNGINAQSSTNIILSDITVKNSLIGINSYQLNGGVIKNCSLTQNVTGLQLNQSYNISVGSCTATRNLNAGFDLINSSTNCFQDCKALSTGEGNNEILNQTIVGFVSANGNANIFERCIANATQALSTTDSQSLVAGFALRGSESCSKIIECESANAQTDETGATVPYGILLQANQFDSLVLVDDEDMSVSSGFQALTSSWSPDGKYIALPIFLSDQVQLYQFDRVSGLLNLIVSQAGAGPTSVSWSPDGDYLAVCFQGGDQVVVYQFDNVSGSLNFVVNQIGDGPTSVSWSPDGAYLAVGFVDLFSSDEVVVYQFDRTSGSLIFVTSQAGEDPFAVSWSPDGSYLAAAFYDLFGSGQVVVYQFDRALGSLDFVDSEEAAQPSCLSWSPDGSYLSAGLVVGGQVVVYQFDRSSGSLTPFNNDFAKDVFSVSWSPDGGYIFVQFGDLIAVYQALIFPSENVINNNTVYCNSGGIDSLGVGISGSSIANMIIGNIAYSNPINPLIVGSNYYFVTNVFNQNFGQAPTDLQNISLDCNQPICMPEDPILLLKQIQYAVTACAPTPIFASNIPTTISESGVYCLADDVTTSAIVPIRITGDNVTVDFNGHTLEDTTGINTVMYIDGADNATIKNGRIILPGGIAILVSGENVLITDMQIINQAADIDIDISITSVSSGCIKNCILFGGDVGINAVGVSNLLIENVIVNEASQIGISLNNNCSSCCIRDCKILSTGNASSSNTISGISLNGGFGNIVENCIVNGTQGNSVTAYDSLVAGISLLSTESCSKIIDCEVANTTVSESGYAVPHGILLQAALNDTIVLVNDADPLGLPTEVDWSPDGKYLAITSRFNVGPFLFGAVSIFEFDRSTNSLTFIVRSDDVLFRPESVSWSPDGRYIVAAQGLFIYVYDFDRSAGSITRVGGITVGSAGPFSVVWSPDGKYVAVALSGTDKIAIYEFNASIAIGINNSDTFYLVGDVDVVSHPFSVSWSPDGRYIAGALRDSDTVAIYEFDRSTDSLIWVIDIAGTGPNSVSWSPDGKYVAATLLGSSTVAIYQFDSSAISLTLIASVFTGGTTILSSVDWSPDGKYVAAPLNVTPVGQVAIYEFDRSAPSLTSVENSVVGDADFVSWSPDGKYIAISLNNDGEVAIYDTLTFPSKNVIKNNTVYCNSVGGNNPRGVGISGSSIANMIIGNTSYANPINPYMVTQNYIFACNVFNQLFGQGPTDLQNISLDGCVPICMPCDPCLLVKQNLALLDQINSKIDAYIALLP